MHTVQYYTVYEKNILKLERASGKHLVNPDCDWRVPAISMTNLGLRPCCYQWISLQVQLAHCPKKSSRERVKECNKRSTATNLSRLLGFFFLARNSHVSEEKEEYSSIWAIALFLAVFLTCSIHMEEVLGAGGLKYEVVASSTEHSRRDVPSISIGAEQDERLWLGTLPCCRENMYLS